MGESSKGAKGMSLLRKLIPRVPVDSSFTSEGSLVVGGVGGLLLSSLSLDSRMFSELDSLLTQACMEESSGEETGVSRLPSSERKIRSMSLKATMKRTKRRKDEFEELQ